MAFNYKHTKYASYLGCITQAIIVNLPPLLFVVFQREFQVTLEQLGLMISLNFGTQILVDFLAAKFAGKLGYRRCVVAAHILCAIGTIGLGVFPSVLGLGYTGILLATVINAIGGGLIEVLISPIIEALPGDEKASAMSILHAFYCWGQVAVVLLSTLYFSLAGIQSWAFLTSLWALIPLFNIWFFTRVPLQELEEGVEAAPPGHLFRVKIFWIFFLLMVCSGAAEQAMAQWASLFAELGLNISKSWGDLLGPCAFAALMGIARSIYGIWGSRMNLTRALAFSGISCLASYLVAVFSPIPLISLIGCAVCGFSVGIMWPGTISLSAKRYPWGGTAMFAILALAGDLGCSAGPGLVGLVSNAVQDGFLPVLDGLKALIPATETTELGLKLGLLAAILFPLILLLLLGCLAVSFRDKKALAPSSKPE